MDTTGLPLAFSLMGVGDTNSSTSYMYIIIIYMRIAGAVKQ